MLDSLYAWLFSNIRQPPTTHEAVALCERAGVAMLLAVQIHVVSLKHMTAASKLSNGIAGDRVTASHCHIP